VFASSAYEVYVTSDIGKNWTQINNGLTNSNIYSLAINETNIFAFAGNTIYSSTDNGANWSVSLSNSIFCLAANGSNIYAGKWGGSVDNGMYRSTDNGLTWADLGAPGKVEVLAFSGSTIYAGIHDTWYSGYSNLVESQNNGNTWNKIGLPLSNVYALSINGNNLYAGYTDVDISKDSGNHWARINPYGDGLLRVYSMYISEKYTLVCAYDGDRTRIWLNNDTINWQPINGNGIDIDMIASSFVISDSIVFIGISQGRNGPGIYYSTNNGHDWKLSIANISVSSLAINDSEIYAGTTNGVYISSNKGTSWVTANNGLEDLSVTALAISGTNIFAGTAQGGIFYSNDNATTWNKVNNGLTNTNIKCLAISGANIFAGTDGGIFHSNDNGSNWTKIGLDTISILSLAINDTNIFAGTGGYGVWKRLLTDFTTGISQKDKNIPIRFSLSQNYPNPFNPNTVISYSLPSASNIKLSVFNTLGQVVRIIENTFKQSGNYSINFNASNLPSGVYFYRIQAGSYIETKKMMLLK
jgi:photosystem II stability/assembly factor-like uncharacterized protein